MGDTGNARVLRVTEDGGAEFAGPALSLEFADADEGMFFCRGVALVVEVVEQGGGGVEIQKPGAFVTDETEAVGFYGTASCDADFHSEGVFAEVFGLGPLTEQLPCLVAIVGVIRISGSGHEQDFTCCTAWFAFLRVSSVFLPKSSV